MNGHVWQIVSYLGGETEEVADYISLFLGYVGPHHHCRANWSLRCVNQKDPTKNRTREWKKGDKYNTFQQGRRWGWQKFILQKQAFQQENGYLGDDLSLCFEAEVEVYGYVATTRITGNSLLSTVNPIPAFEELESQSFCSLSNDFEKLLDNEYDDPLADTEIQCEDKSYYLHSQILAARSPVFLRMLTGSYSERRSSLDDDENENFNNHHHRSKPTNNNSNTTTMSNHGGNIDSLIESTNSSPQPTSYKRGMKFQVIINDIEPAILDEVIRFVYTGKVDLSSFCKVSRRSHIGNSNSSNSNGVANGSNQYGLSGGISEGWMDVSPIRKIRNGNGVFSSTSAAQKRLIAKESDEEENVDWNIPALSAPPVSGGSQTDAATTNTNANGISKTDTSTTDGQTMKKRKRECKAEDNDSNSQVISNDFDVVAALMDAADKYEIVHLRRLCESYLIQTITPQTALNTLVLADRHNAQDLKAHTLRYLSNLSHLTSVRKHSPTEWNELDKTLVNEILNSVVTEGANTPPALYSSEPIGIVNYDAAQIQAALGMTATPAPHFTNRALLMNPSIAITNASPSTATTAANGTASSTSAAATANGVSTASNGTTGYPGYQQQTAIHHHHHSHTMAAAAAAAAAAANGVPQQYVQFPQLLQHYATAPAFFSF